MVVCGESPPKVSFVSWMATVALSEIYGLRKQLNALSDRTHRSERQSGQQLLVFRWREKWYFDTYLYVHRSIGLYWIHFLHMYTHDYFYGIHKIWYRLSCLESSSMVWCFCCCFMCCIWAMLICCSLILLLHCHGNLFDLRFDIRQLFGFGWNKVDAVQVPNHSFLLTKLVSSLLFGFPVIGETKYL